MNLLFDFITTSVKTGAGEYVRRVFFTLLKECQGRDLRIYALWDSRVGIAYSDMLPESLSDERNVSFIDVDGRSLIDIIEENKVDRFFVGCAQYLLPYKGFESISCEVICTIHDLSHIELANEDVDAYLQLLRHKSKWSFINWFLTKKDKHRRRNVLAMDQLVRLVSNNQSAKIVTVSNYSKASIIYHLRINPDRIQVLYGPERCYEDMRILDSSVEGLEGKKFMLVLGCQHVTKNTMKAIKAFGRFTEETKSDIKLLTVGFKGSPLFEGHIPMSFLNDSTLRWAYQNCMALVYPSFFEGFGYPPLEAMRFSKPVLASNIAPIREVFCDAPIYFNPLYESDIFNTLMLLTPDSLNAASQRSEEMYRKITERQERDLDALIDMLLPPPLRGFGCTH